MARVALRYDRTTDVLYVRARLAETLNVPLSPHETLCVDVKNLEVIGGIYEHLSLNYPKIHGALTSGRKPHKQMAEELFRLLLDEWNSFLSPVRSRKALLDFLTHERPGTRRHAYA
ncbi:MAG: hypothetical protein A3C53_00610 [Omnitrophica WOR_2 bacterium RIFCSPHIGHO2_02_FULL_68_15]|nr:MAG: hypothetical protein A3C53_00610 [Omnitrophica WOR_2 bacterium RIFCSPHIGHO2_02_FULL_68_15]